MGSFRNYRRDAGNMTAGKAMSILHIVGREILGWPRRSGLITLSSDQYPSVHFTQGVMWTCVCVSRKQGKLLCFVSLGTGPLPRIWESFVCTKHLRREYLNMATGRAVFYLETGILLQVNVDSIELVGGGKAYLH